MDLVGHGMLVYVLKIIIITILKIKNNVILL